MSSNELETVKERISQDKFWILNILGLHKYESLPTIKLCKHCKKNEQSHGEYQVKQLLVLINARVDQAIISTKQEMMEEFLSDLNDCKTRAGWVDHLIDKYSSELQDRKVEE